jgi:ABC-2 type transport system permease protein
LSSLVVAEFLKFRTTRSAIGFLLAAIALTGVATAGTVGSARDDRLGTLELSREVVSGSLFAVLIAFLVGILSVTTEWRHGTVTRTFLVMPRRGRVLVAKEIWIALLGAALAVLALLVMVIVAVPWLAVENSSLDLGVGGLAARVVVATMLWGALGVGVGAVVQSQTPALVGAIIWILLVEALIIALLGLVDLESIGYYLPARALSAFDGTENADGSLSMWPAGAVSLAWVVGLGAVGYFRMSRQDVT